MPAILIVYHSMTGATLQLARAAGAGAAREVGVQVALLQCSEAHAGHVLRADGFIFATPENLGSMSGMMKDFFDRTYYPVLEHIAGRPYVSLIAAGSDGHGAARQIERIVTGWRLKAIADPCIVCTQAQSPERILAPKTIDAIALARCAELGLTLAAGLSTGIF
jgi:multimeric flavodoxin WrbA